MRITTLHSLCGAALIIVAGTSEAQRAVEVPRVVTPGIQTPVVVVPQGAITPSLPDLKGAPVVQVPQGAVVLIPKAPPVTTERSSPDCSVAEERCATFCYPLPHRWPTYRECVRQYCDIKSESCVEALANTLLDK